MTTQGEGIANRKAIRDRCRHTAATRQRDLAAWRYRFARSASNNSLDAFLRVSIGWLWQYWSIHALRPSKSPAWLSVKPTLAPS